jgi:hypothetical protein
MNTFFLESLNAINKFFDDKFEAYKKKEKERDPCDTCDISDGCEIQDSNCCGIDKDDLEK